MRTKVDSVFFPSVGDSISVQWLLDDEDVWWSAVVTAIRSGPNSRTARIGEVRYLPLRNYGAETMSVVFYALRSSSSRLVSHEKTGTNNNKNDSSSNLCSWVFEQEIGHAGVCYKKPDVLAKGSTITAGESTVHYEPGLSTPSHSPPNRRTRHTYISSLGPSATLPAHAVPTVNKKSAYRLKQDKENTVDSQLHTVDKIMPTAQNFSADNEGGDDAHEQFVSPQPVQHGPEDQVGADATQDAKEDRYLRRQSSPAESYPFDINYLNQTSIPPSVNIRLEHLERKLADVHKSSGSPPSPCTESVKVSLKWALLRQLEKPLKDLKLPDLAQIGVARSSHIVSAQCDYATFREICSWLAKTHRCFESSQRTGRIAFTPSFDIIQSGSCASNNLTIIFSTLSDLASFLGIRDDKDYESMVVKEAIGEDRSLLRLLGTYLVEETRSLTPSATATDDKDGHSSICAESNDQKILREQHLCLYVASTPVTVVQELRRGSPRKLSESNNTLFDTVIIEQKCAHFNRVSNTFQTPWRVRRCTSDFAVTCNFDLDGEVQEENLQTYFTLSWSRLPHPSCKKWTRDVHDIGDNCPGNLTLTVPYIFISANKNVRDLSKILDTTIEYFMSLRSRIERMACV